MLLGLFKKLGVLALVACVATLALPSANAGLIVEYATTGAFDGSPVSPGTTTASLTVTAPGGTTTTITFTGFSDTIITPSNDSFGDFVVSGGTVSQSLAGHTFTLYITQITPPGLGLGTFDATLTGTIVVLSSQAYVEFSTLSQVIDTASDGPVTYQVTNNDRVGGPVTPGAIALAPPKTGGAAGNPTTINGYISSVPEPSTIAMAFSALPVMGLFLVRRRFRQG
jgi:hypothetical protein